MDNFEPVHVTIGENEFYIHPFGAFKAANLSTQLISMLAPIAGVLFGDDDDDDVASSLAIAFGTLSGDKVEKLIEDFLLSKNVAYDNGGVFSFLDKNTCDSLFTKRITELYKLVYEVIKVNYGDFFELLTSQSGVVGQSVSKLVK